MRDDNPELDALLSAMCRELRDQASEVQEGANSVGGLPKKWDDDQFLDSLVDRIVERLAELGSRPVVAIRNTEGRLPSPR
jgi:hypothetical protein